MPPNKDLGIKIGTKTQALWIQIKKEAEILIEQSKNNLIVQRALCRVADEEIEAEKRKMETTPSA